MSIREDKTNSSNQVTTIRKEKTISSNTVTSVTEETTLINSNEQKPDKNKNQPMINSWL